jgi:signal transduction histidine kinase
LLRIAREAVHNAIKYAGAKTIDVTLDRQAEVLQLVITDDGRGFDVAEADTMEGHFGIRGMRERARKLGAELRICSSFTGGTTVELTLPQPAMTA